MGQSPDQNGNRRAPRTSSSAQAGALRAHWLSGIIRESQALLNDSMQAGPTHLRGRTRAFLSRLAQPRTPVEKLVERGLLLELAVQLGHAAHTTFHRAHTSEEGPASKCAFQPAATLEGWPRDLATSPGEALRRWADRYAAAFRDAHPLSCAREAQHYMEQHFSEPLAATELAGRFECSVAFLRRTFKQLTGRSLLEFQSELRLREALRLLAQSDLKVESVAREVGYASKKDLYRVVREHLHCTPQEYRDQTSARSSRNRHA